MRKRNFTIRRRSYIYTLEESVAAFLTKLEFEIYAGGAHLPDYLFVDLNHLQEKASKAEDIANLGAIND